MSTMKFRQRLAWLFVLFFLCCTFACFYYIFEINDHYNRFALDHVQRFHSQNDQNGRETNHAKVSLFQSMWSHVTDIPLPLWMLIFLLPYMQIFLMILACTRPEPKLTIAYMWPGLVYLKYQQLLKREKSRDLSLQNKQSTMISNGSAVLHT